MTRPPITKGRYGSTQAMTRLVLDCTCPATLQGMLLHETRDGHRSVIRRRIRDLQRERVGGKT